MATNDELCDCGATIDGLDVTPEVCSDCGHKGCSECMEKDGDMFFCDKCGP